MANQILFKRQNGVDGQEVSLLCINPQWCTDPAMGNGQAFSGFVDLLCDSSGNFPVYDASEITWDGTNFNVTYTCQSVITLPESDQAYQTVMLPIYYDPTFKVPVSNTQNMGVIVTINFPEGSKDGLGNNLTQKIKKGQPSTSNPKVQPDFPGKTTANHHIVTFHEADASDGSNPANNFGVPRFQVIQSYTQNNQYFILVVATATSDAGATVSAPLDFNIMVAAQLNMVFTYNTSNFLTEVVGIAPSNLNQFGTVLTSNNGYNLPTYPADSASVTIDNTPGDASNDYEQNAIVL